MKNCKKKRRRSVVKPSPCEKNYLFAKQTAGGQWSSQARAKKTTFLQNKLPAASGQAEPVRKNYFFAKQNLVGAPVPAGMSDWHLTTTDWNGHNLKTKRSCSVQGRRRAHSTLRARIRLFGRL